MIRLGQKGRVDREVPRVAVSFDCGLRRAGGEEGTAEVMRLWLKTTEEGGEIRIDRECLAVYKYLG